MELMPALKVGWLNGWIPFVVLVLTEAIMLRVVPRKAVARLFDRSTWSRRQAAFTAIGKAFSLVCIVLVVLTPLKIGTTLFFIGMALYALALLGLIVAIADFGMTPADQPVTKRLYRISRHPQIVMLTVAFLGMCLAIGSWAALLALLLSRLLQHYGILAEEEACLAQYGESYRAYMEQVPRYFLFF